jgi:membrane protein required for colicin V production
VTTTPAPAIQAATSTAADSGRIPGGGPKISPPNLEESAMPVTLLDIVLLAVMLVSALLAMIRGFMREVLSIASWIAAAAVTIYFYPKLLPFAQQHVSNDIIAKAAVIGGLFLGTLIIVSVITIKVSDTVLDSRIGALDRTLGFLFGLGRGLIIVVVAFLFFDWLVPDRSKPDWVMKAKSKVVLTSTGEWLKGMLPDDPESTILKRLKRPKGDEAEPPDAAPPGQRSDKTGHDGMFRASDDSSGAAPAGAGG